MGSYSLLTLAIMVGFMYLNTFATEVLLIPAATLAAALGIAKTIDFIVSLFAGAIIEKVKIGNKGKNQTWLYYGRWVLAVMILLEVCNTSTAPMVVRVAVLSVSYTILNCLMNLIQTGYYGVLAAVAGANMANRNAMSINMTRQSTVITLICSFIPTLVTVLPFGSWNYFVVALVFMIPMPWALGRISALADGKDPQVNKDASGPTITVGDMIGTIVKNPQMLAAFVAFTVMYVATYMYQSNYTYYFIYVVGDFTKLTVASLVAAVVGFVAAMIMPSVKWPFMASATPRKSTA
jgi:Na+/melibiose symporter-like transporter